MITSRNIVLLCIVLFTGLPVFCRELPVLPYPQHVTEGSGVINYTAHISFRNAGIDAKDMNWLVSHWQRFASAYPEKEKAVTVTLGILGKDKAFDASVAREAKQWLAGLGTEGYILIVSPGKKLIAANTRSGLFYGLQTLKQLTRAGWNRPVVIADWPSFPHRAVYDDISRGPISTIDYIKKQIERMAEIKINYLSFYIEHVVQPLSRSDFAPENGKLTIAQIKELSAYAADYNMQLIGSFQSFGHFEKILSLPQYRSMGETSTLISPLDPKARSFLENVIGELCEAFNAPFFNVNCDETFDLTKGRSKPYIDSIGAAKFYADHLKFLYDIVKRHGKRMMMWGDIALQHEEVLDMLPKDVIYLTWEYGEKASFAPWIDPFVKRGLEFIVCPGILNSYRMLPDLAMARANISGFAAEGKQKGAGGVLTTVWDDGGTYLFSGDWYGIYVAAEKSWNVASPADTSFNRRYEQDAYGTQNGNYVKAISRLMELRGLPLTYNLNDQLWYQKLLPDSGRQLIMNNTSATEALHIINEARGYLLSSFPKRNKTDISSLLYSTDQYKLIVETRLRIAEVVNNYRQAAALMPADNRKAGLLLQQSKDSIAMLQKRYTELKERFREAWLNENQPYWLDVVLKQYDKKIADLGTLEKTLAGAALEKGRALPPAAAVRLDITESPRYYFKNWMLAGTFPVKEQTVFPSFIYAENREYDKPPSPGDFTSYLGKNYRWQKFSSPDGGITDLDVVFHNPDEGVSYAYCAVTAVNAATVQAFAAATGDAELFCNGEPVLKLAPAADIFKETPLSLPLKRGVNHILLKLRKPAGRSWLFTFRLAENITVTNHKHKYQLDAKNKVYEAD